MSDPTAKPPKRKPRVPVPFRMTELGRDEMDAVAAELGENRSEFIRQAIFTRIQNHRRSTR